MQCNTGTQPCQLEAGLVAPQGQQDWEDLPRFLKPLVSLAVSARSSRALLRCREVKDPSDLLRLVLGYSVCDWSLRLLGSWYELRGLGHLSPNALRKRLKGCRQWLAMLIAALLRARHLRVADQGAEVRLRIQDATVISRPGSRGTDWRIHLSIRLGDGYLDGIEVSDAHGGETLARFPVQPGEIRLADAGYAQPRGLGTFLHDNGQIVVRTNWQNLRLEEEDGQRFDVAAWLAQSKKAALGEQERDVWLVTPEGRFALRLVVCPLPPEKAEEAQRRVRKASQKKKHNVDARTLLAAGFVLLITNLPVNCWSTHDVLGLYRFRWQVEMLIKRLKSILALDHLRAQDPDLAQTYLLGKMLGALLLEEKMGQVFAAVPTTWDVQTHPISRWRIMTLCLRVLQDTIRGPISQAMVVASLPRLLRFLSDGARKRLSQEALACDLLHALSGC